MRAKSLESEHSAFSFHPSSLHHSMSSIAIGVKNLGKAYRIGLKEQQHETMLGSIAAWVKSPFRNFREVRNLGRFEDERTTSASQPSDIIWALKDVSFEVKHGQAVGII